MCVGYKRLSQGWVTYVEKSGDVGLGQEGYWGDILDEELEIVAFEYNRLEILADMWSDK